MERLEEMASFFNARVDTYERHMREEVDGADVYYAETAKLVPDRPGLRLLDLGCGTGLELDALFAAHTRLGDIEITGIDLAADMLALLRKKHGGRRLRLIQGSYFEVDFGEGVFDVALSVQTMHHFTHEQKASLYEKIRRSLKPGGCYIETDYIAPDQAYEDFYFAEYARLRREQGIGEGFYHYDTPCTVQTQLGLFRRAGFPSAALAARFGNTGILVARI